jgi:amino acid transporter
MAETTLKRSLSLPLLTLYGLGTTVGAGVYVLIGEVAAVAGAWAPVSFLVACGLAAFTALSFAELSVRFPKSAGEAVYVNEGLGSARLATAVGLLVAAVGVVSAAAIVNGVVGYVRLFVDPPGWLVIVAVALALGAVATWGIVESVTLAALITVVEIGGLVLIIVTGAPELGNLPERFSQAPPASGLWLGVLGGAVLAFYAFLGFEDMVNVAEEVKDVRRVMPRAIVLTLAITTVLYVALALVAVAVLPVAELAVSEAPLALVYERAGGSPAVIGLIGIFAVLNGALIQIIMAARVLYGLAAQGWLPAALARINARTRTPLAATALATGVVLALALWLPLVTLAEITSLITLIIFAVVNLALWRLKRRGPGPADAPAIPIWVPVVGGLSSLAFALFQIARFAGL